MVEYGRDADLVCLLDSSMRAPAGQMERQEEFSQQMEEAREEVLQEQAEEARNPTV